MVRGSSWVAAVLLALPLVPTPAEALGTRVIINCRHTDGLCLEDFDDFTASLTSIGAVVEKRSDIPSIVADGDVRLLVVALPNGDWDTPTRTNYIPAFLALGGRLVFLADNEGNEATTNQRIREMLAFIPDHGITLQQNTLNPNSAGGGCQDNPTTLIDGDPFTSGLTEWYFGAVTSLLGGDSLIRFQRDDGLGQERLAVVARLPSGGEVVVFGDVDGFKGGPFQNACATAGSDVPAAHEALWQNLYLDQSAAVDADGDGHDSDVDCNDANPAVHPDADEDCNGVDDNCDGTIDEGCDDDDDSTLTDDDDATGDDDDDSTAPILDGDDDDSTFRDDSGWSSCACGDDAAAGPGLALVWVLPFGAALGRRRR